LPRQRRQGRAGRLHTAAQFDHHHGIDHTSAKLPYDLTKDFTPTIYAASLPL
jgi:hypothetical protein